MMWDNGYNLPFVQKREWSPTSGIGKQFHTSVGERSILTIVMPTNVNVFLVLNKVGDPSFKITIL